MTWFSDPDRAPNCKYPKGLHHVNVYPSGTICAATLNPEESLHREISIPELLYILQDHLAHPNSDDPTQMPAYECYRNDIDEYNQKAKEQAEDYNLKDFLRMASVAFGLEVEGPARAGLEPKGWILVTDTMGGTAVDEPATATDTVDESLHKYHVLQSVAMTVAVESNWYKADCVTRTKSPFCSSRI
jgi:hypothetical protein